MPPKFKAKARYFDPTSGHVNIHPPSTTRPTNPLHDAAYDLAKTEAGSEPLSSSDSNLSRDMVAQKIHDSKKAGSLVRQLFRTDQRDFLSGATSFRVQAAHLVNALRSAPAGTLKKDLKRIKALIESYLTRLCFNGPHQFKLDGRCNLLLLTIQDHYGLDIYGDIVFLPSLEYVKKLLNALSNANTNWSVRCRMNAAATRDIPMDEEPYNIRDVFWETVALYPLAFTPHQGLSFLRPEKRTLREISKPPPSPNTPEDWHTYHLHLDQGVYFIADTTKVDSPSRLQLQFRSIRTPQDQLSLFSMMTVAAAKLKAFMSVSNNEPPEFIIIMHSHLQELVDAIFFHPSSGHDPNYDELVALFSKAEKPGVTVESSDLASRGGFPHHFAPAPHPEPELADGLTRTEYTQLFHNVTSSNPSIRSESGMRLLYGARGYPLRGPPPINPLDMEEFEPEADTEYEDYGDEDSDDVLG
ncbi:hypothetical protein C8R45DRAFT_968156 [Mycena sanguinolenta]|nr:hypothetical protein C8R45DRAFT_968156 [Mycena sanguinolenta]